jgi:hypothetical protein
MIRRLSLSGGCRPDKLKITGTELEFAGLCGLCAKAVYDKRILGIKQLDGKWVNGTYYHHACAPSRKGEYISGGYHPPQPFEVVKGNLPSEEYRYWIGYPDTRSSMAMCRVCRESCYGPKNREEHFKDEKRIVGGMNCATRLVQAYNILLASDTCIVCKRQRFTHSKWGVALCESEVCHASWKFDLTKWAPLEVHLNAQAKRAEIKERMRRNEQAIVHINEGDKPTTEQYCQLCRMFVRDGLHNLQHALKLQGGVYIDDPGNEE